MAQQENSVNLPPLSLPWFLKKQHYLFTSKGNWPTQFNVAINPLTITETSTGRIYVEKEVVVEDSSGPRMHLYTSDNNHRIEIPLVACVSFPFHGYLLVKRYFKDEDVWENETFGKFVALPVESS